MRSTLGGIHKQIIVMHACHQVRGGGGLAHDRSCHIHSQEFTAASATACLACYRYIKQSTRIEKLSLRQQFELLSDHISLIQGLLICMT